MDTAFDHCPKYAVGQNDDNMFVFLQVGVKVMIYGSVA